MFRKPIFSNDDDLTNVDLIVKQIFCSFFLFHTEAEPDNLEPCFLTRIFIEVKLILRR